jgi:hypothetical protein
MNSFSTGRAENFSLITAPSLVARETTRPRILNISRHNRPPWPVTTSSVSKGRDSDGESQASPDGDTEGNVATGCASPHQLAALVRIADCRLEPSSLQTARSSDIGRRTCSIGQAIRCDAWGAY